MTKPALRPATAVDVAAITGIYRPAVLKGTASFEMVDGLARSALAADEAGYRAEFLALAARAQQLAQEVRAAQR